MNLIPSGPSTAPHYFCTWSCQGYDQTNPTLSGWQGSIENLIEARLFGPGGWATDILGSARQDFALLLDVGWDVEPGQYQNGKNETLGSMQLSSAKFPSCTGTPAQRLAALNQITRSHGWKEAALWVAPQLPGENADFTASDAARQEYYRMRAEWCREAGIHYWKVDVGSRGSPRHRRIMTEAVRAVAPDLRLEHSRGIGPVNDEITGWDDFPTGRSGRFGNSYDRYGPCLEPTLEMLRFSDVLRTYDVSPQLSTATTMDRIACLLQHGRTAGPSQGILNIEDEPYMAAALGCTIGMMRHPCFRVTAENHFDPYQCRRRIDEMIRAASWSRIATPMGVSDAPVEVDTALLTDSWFFRRGDGWVDWFAGRAIDQHAPARISRAMPLPEIRPIGPLPPFVVCSRFRHGATAVATLPRTRIDGRIDTPPADVSVEIADWSRPIGLFGTFNSLKLRGPKPDVGMRLWTQDLAGTKAVDITQAAQWMDGSLRLSGDDLKRWGTASAHKGDLSEPGLMLQFVKQPR